MTEQVLTLDEIKERSLEQVLREVIARQEALTVRLPEGEEVTLYPTLRLKPLPTLHGTVPEGWKEAIYG